MEVRETVHSPPFWASASNASNPSPTSPYSSSSTTQSGIKPWIIVLVFSIVVLLFLPSIISTPFKSARFSLSIKSGWDMLNLCLVVFAILCGVLGRICDGSGPESGSYKQPRNEWAGFSNPMGEVNRTAGMRRTRNSSSYPDLRLETDLWGQNRVPDSWRFSDDGELYRTRRPVQLYGVSGPGEEERECKTIPVDTEKFPQLERAENETNFEEGRTESDTIYEMEKKVREAMVVRRRRRSLEALPKWEEVGNEHMAMVERRRRRSLERFPLIEEVEKETNFNGVEAQLEEEVDKRQMVVRRRRKSLENFPIMNEIEEETKFEEEMVEKESEAAERKAKSSEKLPEIEEAEKDTNFGENVVEKPPVVAEVAPPPPPPPPPPLPETKAAEECRKHRRSGSGGGAKDIASAIALFYQKKRKGNKSKRKEKHEDSIESNPNFNSTTESNSNPSAAAPPPPPPPPPSSIFYKLLSNKKGVSKSRRIHSLSASTHSSSPSTVNTLFTPAPLSPQPPHQGLHRPRKDHIDSLGYRRIEDTELYEYRRREKSTVSSYANYPLPPRSPLPPAPPPPPPASVCEIVSGSREQEEQKNGNVAVFCASPDVNDKADLFIKRFRDGLKLEIINSIKEKEKRKERQEREGKLGDENDWIHI